MSWYGVHPTMIHAYRKQLLDGAEDVFQSGVKTSSAEREALQAHLYEQIGRLKTELLNLNRSSYNHEPATDSAANLALMTLIDREYSPRRMTTWLRDKDTRSIANGYSG